MDKSKRKILIVDDKPSNLRFLSKILIEQGYKVQRAISGELALNGAMDATPDLILLDIIMPQMDGYEVCQRLKANPQTREVPVIFLSALNEALDKVKAFQVGGVDYITKPLQAEEVLARIEKQLTLQGLSKQLKEQNVRLQQEIEVRQQAEEQLQQKSQALANFSSNLKQLHRLNTSSYNNFEELFADYLQTGCEILGFTTGIISQIENRTYTIRSVKSDLEFLEPNQTFNLENTYCAAVVRTKQTIADAQVGTLAQIEMHPVNQIWKIESYIGTPIFVNGEIYGTLNFSSTQVRQQNFTDREKELIELMAQSLGRLIATYQAAASLRESERRFRAIFNNSFQFTGLLLPDGTVIETNQTALDFGGIQHRDIAGKPFWDARWWTVSEEIHNQLKEAIAAARRGEFVRYEVDVRGAGDRIATLDFSLKPVFDETGEVVLLISEGRDVTERKQAEIELVRAKATLEQQIQQALLLSQITQKIRSSLNSEQIFRAAATELGQAFGVNRCLIRTYTENPIPCLLLVAEYNQPGLESMLNVEIPMIGNPHVELLLTQDCCVACDDVYADPLLEATEPLCRQLGLKSMLAVRTSYQGKPNGTIAVHQYDRFRHWTGEEMALLEAVAAQLGIAIAQANLLEQETQRRIELDQQNQQLQQAEELLRAQQQKLSFLVQNTPLAVIEWNTNREIVAWNQAAESIFGYSALEAIGKRGWKLIVPNSTRAQVKKLYKQLLTHKSGNHSIIENFTVSGRTVICEWYNTPLLDEHGSVIGFASMAVDITERQHKKLLQKTQNTVLKMVTQGRLLQDILLELTMQIDELTPKLCSSILLVEEDGKHLRPCASPNLPKSWVQLIDPLPIGPDVSPCATAAYFGKRVIVEDIATDPLLVGYRERALSHGFRACWSEPILSDTGKVLGTFALYFSEKRSPNSRELEVIESLSRLASLIIQHKQAEIALQQALDAAESANRAKSDFLASMSHELRTPLNAILGFSQILTRDNSLTPKQREHIEIINRSGEYLLTLINDVLSMSKIEARRVALNENCFDLPELLDSIEQMLQLKANSKGLQLTFKYFKDIPQYVQTDESKLRQVLINLVGNAIKFTQQGSIELRVFKELKVGKLENWNVETSNLQPTTYNLQPLTLHFEIEDTGQGIAADEISTLFDPFVQTRTGRQSMEGTGLGLPISQEFVRLMGGDITVSSTPDRGSIFTFDIKVNLATAADVATKVPQKQVIGLKPNQPTYRILVVEDVAENRQLLVKMLEPLGFEIQDAVNGQEAVVLWQSWQPHLILMDIRMPVMNGYEATKHIKNAEGKRVKNERSFGSHSQRHTCEPQTDNPLLPASGNTPCSFSGERGENDSALHTSTVIIALTASAFDEQQEAILSAGCDDFIRKPFREELLLAKIADHLRVHYIYGEDLTPIPPPWSAQPSSLTTEALRVMPSEWVAQLHQRALAMDEPLIIELIQQIPESQSTLANTLTNLVDNFRLDLIADCSGEVLAQNN